MASNALLKPSLLLALLAILAASGEAMLDQKMKETKLVFYMDDWETGTNATAVMVGGIPTKQWGILQFGTVIAIDDKLTESYDRNSNEVGRAQGMYVNSALDGSDLHLLMSLVFTSGEFNGSTLEIQGADRFYLKYREVPVVSGTGRFRLARGYAVLETLFLDMKNLNAIIRWNVTVYHY